MFHFNWILLISNISVTIQTMYTRTREYKYLPVSQRCNKNVARPSKSVICCTRVLYLIMIYSHYIVQWMTFRGWSTDFYREFVNGQRLDVCEVSHLIKILKNLFRKWFHSNVRIVPETIKILSTARRLVDDGWKNKLDDNVWKWRLPWILLFLSLSFNVL